MTGSNSLDVPVASLAGLAVAFLAFAAPADLLASLVGATGIASIIPAAQPPLGLTARVALGAGGSVVVFGIALLVLRWLGRVGTKPAEAEAEETPEPVTPRLRRRDIHPDAPARAPLLAVHELGEPALELNQAAPEPEPEPEPLPQPEPDPLPEFVQAPASPLLARKPDRSAPREPEPDMVASREPDAAQEPAAAAYALSQRNWADFEPEPEPEPDIRYPSLERAAITREAKAEAVSPPVPPLEIEEIEEPTAPLASWYALQAEAEAETPPAVEIVAEPAPDAAWSAPEPEIAEIRAEPAEPWAPQEHGWPDPAPIAAEPEPVAPEPVAKIAPTAPEPRVSAPPVGSIAELMERLERGLARHRVGPPSAAPAAMPAARAAAPRPLSPDPSDDRLQSAIESLQRFASRQD